MPERSPPKSRGSPERRSRWKRAEPEALLVIAAVHSVRFKPFAPAEGTGILVGMTDRIDSTAGERGYQGWPCSSGMACLVAGIWGGTVSLAAARPAVAHGPTRTGSPTTAR